MHDPCSIKFLFDDFVPLTGAQFLYDAETNIAYVCILKNAHSWASRLFIDNLGAKPISAPPDDAKVVVILRHPVSRWISGFSQFMTEYDQSYLSLLDDPRFRQIIFDVVRWDDHTARQIDAISSLNIKNCLFFKCNIDLEKSLINFISSVKSINTGDVINNNLYNRSDDGSIRPIVYSKLQRSINSNSSFKKRILDYYDFDMKLIAHINYNDLWYSPNTNT